MQGCTGPPKTSTDDDQDEQFWNDIKAETGYSSYKSYVETLARSGQGLGKLLNHLNFSGLSDAKGEIVVLDIQKDGSTVTSFSAIYSEGKPPRTSQGSQLENASKMSYRLLQNLRSPPEDIPARIVLWSITRGSRPDGGIIEALGLGLDIDPSFFEILVQMNPLLKKRHWRWYTEQAEQAVRTKQAMGSNQVTIGDSIVTIAQEYRRERHPPPVLVIAGSFDMDMGFWIDDRALDQPYHGIVNDEVHWEFSGGTSLFRSATDRVLTNDLASVPSNYYLKLLSKYVYKDCYDDAEVDTEFDTILLIAVLPLLRLEIFRLRGLCTTMRSALRLVQFDVEDPGWTVEREKVERYTALDRYRFWLRRRLENLQESRDTFQNLARSQNAAHWLGTKQWLRQDADIGEALVMARAKEAEVRDYMQLQIGNLSISESRKSIQLSNQQMNEAKRGKHSIQSSFMISADRGKVRIRTQLKYLVSRLTLTSLSHHLGFRLRPY